MFGAKLASTPACPVNKFVKTVIFYLFIYNLIVYRNIVNVIQYVTITQLELFYIMKNLS